MLEAPPFIADIYYTHLGAKKHQLCEIIFKTLTCLKKNDMPLKRLMRNIFLLSLVLLNISCDQLSKRLARNSLSYYEEIKVIKHYFILTKVENSGAFLSLGNDLPFTVRLIFLTILPCLILAFGLYYLVKNNGVSILFAIGIAFAIGGGIGNLYDRVVHGSVTDFMYIHYAFIKTGIFNMADVSIMVGMCLILLGFRSNRQQHL